MSASDRTAADGEQVMGDRFAFVAVFLVALLLRVGATLDFEAAHPHAEQPVIDEASYDGWAREIAAGDWVGDEVFFQEPLYPYVMAVVYRVFDGDRTGMRHLQCSLGALTCVLVALLGRRLFGRAAGLVAGFGLALYVPGLWFPALLLKENVFAPLLIGLALAMVSARRPLAWLGIGGLAGLGALLRGNLLVMLPAIVAWPVVVARARRSPLRPALVASGLALLGLGAVLAPVALRNRAVGGELVLTTSGAGTNLYGGNNLANPYGRATEFDWVRGIPAHEAADWRREAERRLGRELSPSEVSGYWRDQVFASAADEPLAHLSILWNKLRLTLGRYEVPDNHMLDWDARYVALLASPLPGFGILGTLGLAGVAFFVIGRSKRVPRSPEPDPSGVWQVLVLATLYLGTVVLTVTSARIRWPLVPLLAPFAGDFVVRAVAALRARRADVAGPLVACVAFAGLVVFVPVLGAEERALDLEKRDYNLAVQYLDEGRLDEALALVDELRARHPLSARLVVLDAELGWRDVAGERASADPVARARAEDRLERSAVALAAILERPGLNARERFRTQAALGWILLESGRGAEAAAALAEARAFDDEDPALAHAHARALLEAAAALTDAAGRERDLGQARVLLLDVASRTDDGEVLVDLARTEFDLGRARLDAGAQGQAREQARDFVRAALKRLRPLDTSSSDRVRWRARSLAGRIQLWLGNAPSAERHLAVALALFPDDPVALQAHVEALVRQLEDGAADVLPAVRTEKAQAARSGLRRLAETQGRTPGVRALEARLASLD